MVDLVFQILIKFSVNLVKVWLRKIIIITIFLGHREYIRRLALSVLYQNRFKADRLGAVAGERLACTWEETEARAGISGGRQAVWVWASHEGSRWLQSWIVRASRLQSEHGSAGFTRGRRLWASIGGEQGQAGASMWSRWWKSRTEGRSTEREIDLEETDPTRSIEGRTRCGVQSEKITPKLWALIPCEEICNLYFHEAIGQYIYTCRCGKFAENPLYSGDITWLYI